MTIVVVFIMFSRNNSGPYFPVSFIDSDLFSSSWFGVFCISFFIKLYVFAVWFIKLTPALVIAKSIALFVPVASL